MIYIRLFKILQMLASITTIILGITVNNIIITVVGSLGILFAFFQYQFEIRKEKKDEQYQRDNDLKHRYTDFKISRGKSISTYIDVPHTTPIYSVWYDLPQNFSLLEIVRLIELNWLSKDTISYLDNYTDFKARKNELNTNIRTISQ